MSRNPRPKLDTAFGLLRDPRVFLPAILFVYLVGRIILVLGGEVFTSHDSAVYAPRGDSAPEGGSLVSFFGNAPRPWGLPVFYAIFADDHARAVAQWAFATIAWGLLAIELTSHLRAAGAKAFTAAAITVLALTSTVANWDFAILTESMSTSIGVVVLALGLRWKRLRRPIWLVLMTLAAVWWTFIRPDIRVFTLLLMAVLGFVAWRVWRSSPGLAKAAALCAVTLLLAVGWYAAITPAMAAAFKPFDGDAPRSGSLPSDQYFFVHRLRTIVFTDPATEATFRAELGMPSCAAVDAFATRSTWDVSQFAEAFLSCPQLTAWAQANQYDFWGSFAAAAPGPAASKYLELVSMTLGGDVYADVPQVVPAPVERILFPSQRLGLPIALAGFTVALALALWTGSRRLHPFLIRVAIVLFGAALLSTAATVLMGTGEYRRFGMQEMLFAKVSVIILVACAFDTWLRRRSEPERRGNDTEKETVAASQRG